MVSRIVLNTISYHGHGAIENIVPELTSRGYKKAFVCSDPDLIKFGVTRKVTDLLDAAGFAYSVYSEIKPNPTIQNVQDGVEAFKKAEADCIVTIGGGSSMDTAKAIGIIINNPEFADVRSLEGVVPTKKHAVFTIAVPTIAGTAAEVTINYVITDVEKKRKFVCVDTNDTPEVAVVDPDMMASMPKGLTALYDTPHGVACAILLPVGMEYNKSVAGERYRAVGKAMGVVGIDAMSDADACCPGNPRHTSVEEIKELYKSQL